MSFILAGYDTNQKANQIALDNVTVSKIETKTHLDVNAGIPFFRC
jgi:hypothetical protein